jgi:GNAT superfamily N-acetyltransferase
MLKIDVAPLEVAVPVILEAARRLEARGEMLWNPADITVETLGASVMPHEVFVGMIGTDAAVAAFVQERDPYIWPGQEDSLFIHKLAVGDRFVGQGIAKCFVDWAAILASQRRKRFLRLDTDSTRPKLCAFYVRQGFNHVGTRTGGGFTYALYERPVLPIDGGM